MNSLAFVGLIEIMANLKKKEFEVFSSQGHKEEGIGKVRDLIKCWCM